MTLLEDALPFYLEPQEEGGFVAFSSEYPGAVGQGETEEEAIKDLEEAIQTLKEFLKDRDTKVT
ncbi:type II toxin-antitoxin system HicB family antitoxin [Candidatus Bathyarchaeota archaeon]|nr:MAG: type II toxin-antitoxin system HicB family antitoxin [Candidatus Bathyarchaeota archaeon]